MEEQGELKETKEGYQIKLRNWSGVPVLEFVGELNRAGLSALERTLSTLANAGHYHVVLNIQKAVQANARALAFLGRAAKRINSHYGSVELVAQRGLAEELLERSRLAKLFRLCASEAQAVRRIKRLQRSPDPAETGWEGTTARIKVER